MRRLRRVCAVRLGEGRRLGYRRAGRTVFVGRWNWSLGGGARAFGILRRARPS